MAEGAPRSPFYGLGREAFRHSTILAMQELERAGSGGVSPALGGSATCRDRVTGPVAILRMGLAMAGVLL
jgi:hypothetical protein